MTKLNTVLDLRLFDISNDYTQTTLLNTPGNDLSPEMKTYYHDRLIDNAEPNLVHDQFGDDYPIPKHGGKTIEFRKYDPLPKALTKLTEGVTPKGNKLNVTTITATVDQYGDFVELSDMLELTAIDRNIEVATKLLGAQAGRTLDTVTREVITGGSNKLFAPAISPSDGSETEVLLREDITTSCKLTPKVIRKAVAKLKRMNTAPFEGGYYAAIIHPDIVCDIQNDPEWQESHKYATPENMYRGEIGRIGGARFVESTEAKIIGPEKICGILASRTTAQEAASAGAVSVKPNLSISSADATAINAAIAGGAVYKVYINGEEHTISQVTAGAPGTAAFTIDALTDDVSAGDIICGTGAGKDGSAIYCTMIIGLNAYGKTSVQGGGLQHIVKQLGSGGTTDPLNQRATTGWKATKVAERLVEAYMVRIEHSSESFGAEAESN